MKLETSEIVGYIESIDMTSVTFSLKPLRQMISTELKKGTSVYDIYAVLIETKVYLNDKLRKNLPNPHANYKEYNIFVTQSLQISNIIMEIDLLIASLVDKYINKDSETIYN